MTDEGELDLDSFQSLLSERTKLLAVTHVSNVLGTVNPVKELIGLHMRRRKVPIDGAQAVAHIDLDLKALTRTFTCSRAISSTAPHRRALWEV